MDTKSKNYRYSTWFKLVTFILSLILISSSSIFAVDVVKTASLFPYGNLINGSLNNYDFTNSQYFKKEFTRDLLAANIIATQNNSKELGKYLKQQKDVVVQENYNSFKQFKENKIRKGLIAFASITDDIIDDVQYNKELYVPEKQISNVVDINENASLAIRQAQKIVNGTKKGDDFLQYEDFLSFLLDSNCAVDFDSTEQWHRKNFSAKYNSVKYDEYYKSETELDCFSTLSEAKKQIAEVYDDNLVSAYVYKNGIVQWAQDTLNDQKCFKYYIKNNSDNKVYTNVKGDNALKTLKLLPYTYSSVFGKQTSKDISDYNYNSNSYLSDDVDCFSDDVDCINTSSLLFAESTEIYVAVDLSADAGSVYNIIKTYSDSVNVKGVVSEMAATAILAVLAFISLLLGAFCSGKKRKDDDIRLLWIDYLPTDIHAGLSLSAIGGFVYLIYQGIDYVTNINEMNNNWVNIGILGAIIAIWCLYSELTYSFIRVCKSSKHLYKNCFVFMILKWIFLALKALFSGVKKLNKKIVKMLSYTPDNYKKNVVKLVILYGVGNLLAICLCAVLSVAVPPVGVILFLALIVANGFAIRFACNYLLRLDEIITAAKERRKADFDVNRLPQSLKTLAESLEYTNAELQNAVEKAVKDERLKAELITNVSHDLKTPLTSIITYVDLLSKCDIENDKAYEYIGVLNDKSAKLKRLIDDLIEASKVSSGNIVLNPVVLNLNELTAQAVGESESEFSKNNIDLVFDNDSKSKPIFADGSKTYRIIENLLSNAKKYSATGSRVYVKSYLENGMGVFEIKNISAKPLNITADELTERFVRGDQSRSKEGNGLGLSIAKELCKAQGGELQIIIDGDLFKAKVYLPTEPKNCLE